MQLKVLKILKFITFLSPGVWSETRVCWVSTKAWCPTWSGSLRPAALPLWSMRMFPASSWTSTSELRTGISAAEPSCREQSWAWDGSSRQQQCLTPMEESEMWMGRNKTSWSSLENWNAWCYRVQSVWQSHWSRNRNSFGFARTLVTLYWIWTWGIYYVTIFK